METREIKKEIVERTEYVAEDGTVFDSMEECKKYESSALFIVTKKLKKIKEISQYDINDHACDDEVVEVFDIKDETDLDNLAKYLYLTMSAHGASANSIEQCFHDVNKNRGAYVFEKVTYGHEVMIFWSYDMDWFWVHGDGSINGYLEYTRKRMEKAIWPNNEK